MVKIESLNKAHLKAIKAIQLGQEQLKFAPSAEEFLKEEQSSVHPHIIKLEDELVGYFKLDLGYSSGYDFCPKDSIGLRSFVIDKEQQGKGLGTQSVKALFPYLAKNYSKYNSIYLTVNCKNIGAYSCYQKAGFVDTKEQYLGGPSGPQHIMCGEIG